MLWVTLGTGFPALGKCTLVFPGLLWARELLWAGELLLASPEMAILKPASCSKAAVQFSVILVRDFGFHHYLDAPCLCAAEGKSGIDVT